MGPKTPRPTDLVSKLYANSNEKHRPIRDNLNGKHEIGSGFPA
jgi:hypothetical protein